MVLRSILGAGLAARANEYPGGHSIRVFLMGRRSDEDLRAMKEQISAVGQCRHELGSYCSG